MLTTVCGVSMSILLDARTTHALRYSVITVKHALFESRTIHISVVTW